MSSYLLTLATIAGLYMVAVASPGPNFFVISQLAVTSRKRLAVLVALGITMGSFTWALMAMFGIATLLARIDWLYAAIRLAGAAYLIWFGIRLLRNSARPRTDTPRPSGPMTSAQALRTGLLTSLTNPKSGAFWVSVFASAFPADAPAWLYAVTAAMIALLSSIWHIGIAFVFTNERVQTGYRRLRRSMDAACGIIVIFFGFQIIRSH